MKSKFKNGDPVIVDTGGALPKWDGVIVDVRDYTNKVFYDVKNKMGKVYTCIESYLVLDHSCENTEI